MKTLLAHLIPAPFTQHVGQALYEGEMLDRFLCTLIDEPCRRWQRGAKQLAGWVGYDLARDLRRRSVTAFPLSKVKTYPFREVVRMGIHRLLPHPVVGDYVFHWARDGFDRWVARNIGSAEAVYGYEYGSLAMFESAKCKRLRTIYDLPSPEHDFVERILAPEFARFPELNTSYRRRVVQHQGQRTERRRQEWDLADLVIANSSFTAESWKAAGWQEKRVLVIPYGAPPVTQIESAVNHAGPLRGLWAGTFSIRKGAHYLIEAMRQLDAKRERVRIDVYGAVTLPKDMLRNLPSGLNFKGSVPREELFAAMREAELLVFPTLCDGFGLVVNEAFAQGLPVLTTQRAGASDLIKENQNGWLVAPGDAVALADGLCRVLNERKRLPAVSEAAKATAAGWQWSDYRREIVNAVSSLRHA